MSNQLISSDLLLDLSTEQQQLLAGGQMMGFDDDDDDLGEGTEDSENNSTPGGINPTGTNGLDTNKPRRYRINSSGIISVQKLD